MCTQASSSQPNGDAVLIVRLLCRGGDGGYCQPAVSWGYCQWSGLGGKTQVSTRSFATELHWTLALLLQCLGFSFLTQLWRALDWVISNTV